MVGVEVDYKRFQLVELILGQTWWGRQVVGRRCGDRLVRWRFVLFRRGGGFAFLHFLTLIQLEREIKMDIRGERKRELWGDR